MAAPSSRTMKRVPSACTLPSPVCTRNGRGAGAGSLPVVSRISPARSQTSRCRALYWMSTAVAVFSHRRVPSASSICRRSPMAVRASALHSRQGTSRQASQAAGPASSRPPAVRRTCRRAGRSRRRSVCAPNAGGTWPKLRSMSSTRRQAAACAALRSRQRSNAARSATDRVSDWKRTSQPAASSSRAGSGVALMRDPPGRRSGRPSAPSACGA